MGEPQLPVQHLRKEGADGRSGDAIPGLRRDRRRRYRGRNALLFLYSSNPPGSRVAYQTLSDEEFNHGWAPLRLAQQTV
jgi:hypothetical protein